MKNRTHTRILIADDHELMRHGIRQLLTNEGYSVVDEAGDGRELIAKARSLRPDVLVVDITMPELNGIDAIRAVRKELPEVVAVVLSVHDSDSLISSVLAAGAGGYVLKSDAAKDIANAVSTVLEGKVFLSPSLAGRASSSFFKPDEVTLPALTPREREIVQLVAEGKTSKEIADRLGTSSRTVETQRASIMDKLGAKSVADIVRWAIRNNLVLP